MRRGVYLQVTVELKACDDVHGSPRMFEMVFSLHTVFSGQQCGF